MESLFSGGVDLAAVASAAGLGGSAVGAVGALIFFKGFIMRVLAQVIVTAILTGIGFLALLNVLGFQITPIPQTALAAPTPGAESFSPQSVPAEPAGDPGKKVYYVRSPWSKG